MPAATSQGFVAVIANVSWPILTVRLCCSSIVVPYKRNKILLFFFFNFLFFFFFLLLLLLLLVLLISYKFVKPSIESFFSVHRQTFSFYLVKRASNFASQPPSPYLSGQLQFFNHPSFLFSYERAIILREKIDLWTGYSFLHKGLFYQLLKINMEWHFYNRIGIFYCNSTCSIKVGENKTPSFSYS